jgi:type IV pilus assembly protein PilV
VIEGLIAITVFSLGILGLIGLQANVFEHNAQAQYRAEASYLAEEIIGLATADALNVDCYTVPAAGTCTNAAAEQAAQDWATRVQAALSGAAETPPTVERALDGTVTVTIQWKRQNEDTVHNYVSVTNI